MKKVVGISLSLQLVDVVGRISAGYYSVESYNMESRWNYIRQIYAGFYQR